MPSPTLSNPHSAMREDTILKRKRIPSFPEQQSGSWRIIRCLEDLRPPFGLWRTLNCAIGMKFTLLRLILNGASFMPIRRVDFRRRSGFLFSHMNISMPDCDYVINDWLHEMEIGRMPSDGLLYDETLHNKSAESIYDLILQEIRKYKKMNTFRGFGRGDIVNGNNPVFSGGTKGVSLDELLPDELKSGETAKGQLQLIPGVHKTDGFFLAKFRKTEKGRA